MDDIEVDAWEVKEHCIYARIKDPGLFTPKSFRWITLSKEKGIHAIIGELKGSNKTSIQAHVSMNLTCSLLNTSMQDLPQELREKRTAGVSQSHVQIDR
ncbi:MAG: hypothetical protein HXS40_00235 [Theionarchaea archaeon]|nr:hypothetical protein [Theionarchaea archaeon]